MEFVNELREKLQQERSTWHNINEEQYSKLISLLSEKGGAIKQRDKKENLEQKNLISWDNFLGIIEELKRKPDLVFESLSEWEKMNSSDQELAKVVQKIISEGEELKSEVN